MISLIPCYSLEDFSLFRKASEVDEIFSAWSALYHPALNTWFQEVGSNLLKLKERSLFVISPTETLFSKRHFRN